MKIKSVHLKDFRNYEAQEVDFFPELNVLFGENASGKTNLIEAVYLCGVGRSPRTSKDKELIRYGAESASVKLVLEKKYRQHTVEIYISKNGKKAVKIDGLPVQKMGDLLGTLNVVFFSPDEMRFIKDTPDLRRRFMDISLSQQKKSYFYALQRYSKILKQRNTVLKQNEKTLSDMLDIFDEQLSKEGAEIIWDRQAFLRELSLPAADAHSAISGGKEELVLSYETDTEGATKEELQKNLKAQLFAGREKDARLQFTNCGPHRDDIKILLNGTDARKFASQGQQRTTALSVKIAELRMFEKETGELPVLLLDDVLSELDEKRQKFLIEAAKSVQVILTGTSYNVDKPAALFKVENGKCSFLRKNT